ncbi:MAG: hypothetical protein NC210_04935 [[Clostridium] fimetarium]|nr:hypothetical protein [Alistipes timonensis]MCM1405751.1 hypothetical protein [[Clostridium] fimetarium]
MNKQFKYGVLALMAAATIVACKDDEVYKTSVTRDIELTLDGKPYNVHYGQDDGHDNQRILFIYRDNGAYFGNYGSTHRFALEDGSYKIFATQQVDTMLTKIPNSLGDVVFDQDKAMKLPLAISDPVNYSAGGKLKIAIKTRTGMLRLRATDEKADKSYSKIKAVISTNVTGWKVSSASVITGDTYDLEVEKETAGGGVGYTQDAVLLGSEKNPVNVRIDYLDAQDNVVRSKPFAEPIAVLPNDTTEVSFNLNDANERVIVNYNVQIGSQRWTEAEIYPSVKVDVPDGYTYVAPDQDLTTTITEQMADASISEIKIFLKANSTYNVKKDATASWTKSIHLLGQTPGFGQNYATVSMGSDAQIGLAGTFDHITFENIRFVPQTRLFNLRNTQFDINTIELINCDFDNWNTGVIWFQASNADNQQKVGTMRMKGCRVTNYTSNSSAGLFRPQVQRLTTVANWEIDGCLFHSKNFSTRDGVILCNLKKLDGPVDIKVTNNIFIDTRGSNYTYFNIDLASASSANVTFTGNTVSGSANANGKGTFLKIAGATATASGNSRTAGYSMAAYGIDTPAESATTYEELLNQQNL